MVTYEILSLANNIWYLFKACKVIDVRRECRQRIADNFCLSVNGELYHKICFNRSIERSCWKYFETLNLIDLVHLNTRAFSSN
jgi:hypothetical protein